MISRPRTTALILIVVLASGCARNELREPDRELEMEMQQDYLAHMLLPPSWDEARRHRVLRRIEILNWHLETFMGGTLGHIQFEIDADALEEIIGAQERERIYFSRAPRTETIDHAFGERSNLSFDKNGETTRLDWWHATCSGESQYVTWSWDHVNTPFERVFVQIYKRESHRNLVSLRFESD